MEAMWPSECPEPSVEIYQITQHYIPEDGTLNKGFCLFFQFSFSNKINLVD
jgi:hypothetical protein